MKRLEPILVQDGINYLSPVDEFAGFEELYIKIRLKERRLLNDDAVKQLPYVKREMSVHFQEWKMRAHSYERLRKYIQKINQPVTLMDLGCGNGWLAARLTENSFFKVFALDINSEELKQGARVFHHRNLAFYYGNIFEDIFPPKSFDFILLNACAQYFEDLNALIDRLFFFLKKKGEIHIIDTPFYKKNEIDAAKQRTENYYKSIDFPEMAGFYHHHSIVNLPAYCNHKILSHSTIFYNVYALVTGHFPGYFPWIRIIKETE